MSSDKNPLVLFCHDGAEHSSRAFNWYQKYFYRDDHVVGLVNIYFTPICDENEVDQRKQAVRKKSIDSTRQFQEFCERKGIITRVFIEEKVESVGFTVCKIAKENNASLILMGQRGLGAIQRALYGSVSEYVLHHAHIPVLIVPPEEK